MKYFGVIALVALCAGCAEETSDGVDPVGTWSVWYAPGEGDCGAGFTEYEYAISEDGGEYVVKNAKTGKATNGTVECLEDRCILSDIVDTSQEMTDGSTCQISTTESASLGEDGKITGEATVAFNCTDGFSCAQLLTITGSKE